MHSYCIELTILNTFLLWQSHFTRYFVGLMSCVAKELFLKKESLSSPILMQNTFEFYYKGYSSLAGVILILYSLLSTAEI